MKILIHPPVDEELKAQVEHTAPEADVVMVTHDNALEHVLDADILFGSYTNEMIATARQLKWIQTTSAGMDGSQIPGELKESDIVVTNASGVHAVQVAEHAFALTIALLRGLQVAFANQARGIWQGAPMSDLYNSTVGIIGFGGIGRKYAEQVQAFQTRILALDIQTDDKPAYVESLWGMDRLDDLLRQADIVFLACPLTPETDKLICQRTLGLMKKTAFLVNTARGGIVNEADLVQGLRNGDIAGAGLDVFETEPLPADSPLWKLDNVILTTHAAGSSPKRHHRTVGFFCHNLRKYLAGEPLVNEIDKNRGYPAADRRDPQSFRQEISASRR